MNTDQSPTRCTCRQADFPLMDSPEKCPFCEAEERAVTAAIARDEEIGRQMDGYPFVYCGPRQKQ